MRYASTAARTALRKRVTQQRCDAAVTARVPGADSPLECALLIDQKFYDQFWYGGTVEKAEELLKKGALINYRCKSGGTALTTASSGGKMGHVMFLIENKCDLNITEGNRGETALIRAARKGQMAVARVLVDAGADITIRDKKRNKTAAEHANDRGAWDLHKYLKNLTK